MRLSNWAVGLAGGIVLLAAACSGSNGTSGFGTDDGGASSSGSTSGSSSGTSSGTVFSSSGATSSSSGSSSGTVTTTTVYAHTDTELFSLDPSSLALKDIGPVSGLANGDTSITDLAVDAEGDVYINSETTIYKATLPASGTGTVPLSVVATIATGKSQYFYALGFTPKDALGAGTGEVLIGGDGNGELWAISTSNGALKDLGSFGTNPVNGYQMGLSGDVFFYTSTSGQPTGLATIRGCSGSCSSSSSSYTTDYLVGIDMTALANAYSSGSPASSLNAGYYGAASSSDTGPGIGYKEVFGLGAWNGTVFGFTHTSPVAVLTIGTSGSGAGAGKIASSSSSDGWAGAGVTSSVTVTVAPPPIAPK